MLRISASGDLCVMVIEMILILRYEHAVNQNPN